MHNYCYYYGWNVTCRTWWKLRLGRPTAMVITGVTQIPGSC